MIFHTPFQITDLKNFKIKNVFIMHVCLNKYLKVNLKLNYVFYEALILDSSTFLNLTVANTFILTL